LLNKPGEPIIVGDIGHAGETIVFAVVHHPIATINLLICCIA